MVFALHVHTSKIVIAIPTPTITQLCFVSPKEERGRIREIKKRVEIMWRRVIVSSKVDFARSFVFCRDLCRFQNLFFLENNRHIGNILHLDNFLDQKQIDLVYVPTLNYNEYFSSH